MAQPFDMPKLPPRHHSLGYKHLPSEPPAAKHYATLSDASSSSDSDSSSSDDDDRHAPEPEIEVDVTALAAVMKNDDGDDDQQPMTAARAVSAPPPPPPLQAAVLNPYDKEVTKEQLATPTSVIRCVKTFGMGVWKDRVIYTSTGQSRTFFTAGDSFIWGPFGEWIIVSKCNFNWHKCPAKPNPEASHMVTAESIVHTGLHATFVGTQDGTLTHITIEMGYKLYHSNAIDTMFKNALKADPQNLSRGRLMTDGVHAMLPFTVFYHRLEKLNHEKEAKLQKQLAPPKKRKEPPALDEDGQPIKKPRTKKAPPLTQVFYGMQGKRWQIYLYERLIPQAQQWASEEKGRKPSEFVERKFLSSAQALDTWARDNKVLFTGTKVTPLWTQNAATVAERAGSEMKKRIKRYNKDYAKMIENWQMEMYVTSNPAAWTHLQELMVQTDNHAATQAEAGEGQA